jgi:hypothetical protein
MIQGILLLRVIQNIIMVEEMGMGMVTVTVMEEEEDIKFFN